jgi:hypothetical protein
MRISALKIALFVGGYLWWKGKKTANSLHSKIIKVRIADFWNNLKRGAFVLELTFLLENQSNLEITVNQFAGRLNWRGNNMADIDLPWDATPILPGQRQEIPFAVRGKFSSGIAAIILAMQNPGSRILEGVTVDGNITTTINRTMITFPYHQEISITL